MFCPLDKTCRIVKDGEEERCHFLGVVKDTSGALRDICCITMLPAIMMNVNQALDEIMKIKKTLEGEKKDD